VDAGAGGRDDVKLADNSSLVGADIIVRESRGTGKWVQQSSSRGSREEAGTFEIVS
jgi:hypothetical protein